MKCSHVLVSIRCAAAQIWFGLYFFVLHSLLSWIAHIHWIKRGVWFKASVLSPLSLRGFKLTQLFFMMEEERGGEYQNIDEVFGKLKTS